MGERVTTAAIIEKDGQFLLIEKIKTSSIGQVWEFPGGKSRPGESSKDAVIRECLEELNLTVVLGELLFEHRFVNKEQEYRMDVFSVSSFSGDLILSDDHLAYQWVTKEQLESLPMSPSDRKISSFILLNNR